MDDGDDDCDLANAVSTFNDWVGAAGFPVLKIKAALIPGMRIGAVATSGELGVYRAGSGWLLQHGAEAH